MKRIKSILICGLVLALTGVTTLVVAASSDRNAKATVRSVIGKVTYRLAGGEWLPLKVNQELAPSTELKSEAGMYAYLQVNGLTSTVKLTENTTVTLAKMTTTGPGLGADTSTDLKLDGGSLLGSVRKLSANSDYKVSVPSGTAGIRGTDFQVTVILQANGVFTITFTSVTGTVFCQVSLAPGVTGQNSQTLTSGQSWTVTGGLQGVVTLGQPVPLTLEQSDLWHSGFQPPLPPVTPTAPTQPPVVPPNTSSSETGGNGAGSGGSGGSGGGGNGGGGGGEGVD